MMGAFDTFWSPVAADDSELGVGIGIGAGVLLSFDGSMGGEGEVLDGRRTEEVLSEGVEVAVGFRRVAGAGVDSGAGLRGDGLAGEVWGIVVGTEPGTDMLKCSDNVCAGGWNAFLR